jgi:hypothetical protein
MKGNMMHGMENYNNGIMCQLVIKVMNNICDATHAKSNGRRCIK